MKSTKPIIIPKPYLELIGLGCQRHQDVHHIITVVFHS